MANYLNRNIIEQISDSFKPFSLPENIEKYKVLISFIITKEGKIVLQSTRGGASVNSESVNIPELDKVAQESFQTLIDMVHSGEITIEPAKDENLKAINYSFTLPITLK